MMNTLKKTPIIQESLSQGANIKFTEINLRRILTGTAVFSRIINKAGKVAIF